MLHKLEVVRIKDLAFLLLSEITMISSFCSWFVILRFYPIWMQHIEEAAQKYKKVTRDFALIFLSKYIKHDRKKYKLLHVEETSNLVMSKFSWHPKISTSN